MKQIISALLALVPMSFAIRDDSVKTEFAKLEGVWQVVSHQTEGKAANEEHWTKVHFTFKGNELTFKGDDILSKKAAKITLVIDPSTTPKVIDMSIVAGEFKGTVLEGIYEIKDDSLKICFRNEEKKNRPNDFTTKDDSGLVLFVLHRERTWP
jgi:uncharacterized protein (TIGR03067 family)